MAASMACEISQVRDWIWATAAAIPDTLTHYTGLGIEPVPP